MTARRRALIVSLDAARREEITLGLQPSGYNVTAVGSFHDAKRVLGDAPDLLVTEVRLGAYNGIHLVICAQLRDPSVRSIIMGTSDPVLEVEASRVGALYLSEPVGRKTLVDAVDALLDSDGRSGRRWPRKQIAPVDAFADNVGGRVMDVSYEGVRLAVPVHLAPIPRAFTLRIPGGRLALPAEWVWMSESGQRAERVVFYGVRLSHESARVSAAWRAIVDSSAGVLAWTT